MKKFNIVVIRSQSLLIGSGSLISLVSVDTVDEDKALAVFDERVKDRASEWDYVNRNIEEAFNDCVFETDEFIIFVQETK